MLASLKVTGNIVGTGANQISPAILIDIKYVATCYNLNNKWLESFRVKVIWSYKVWRSKVICLVNW